MSRTTLIVAALACGLAALAPGQTESRPASQPDPKLRIELKADPTTVKAGEMPRFTAMLVNEGSSDVTVVLPGDGSDYGWRTPVIRWSPPMYLGGRTGNINALKAGEVVTLAAGKRVSLGEWLGHPTLMGFGKRDVSMELENVPDLAWQGLPLGEHDAETMAKVRSSTRFVAKSNVLEIDVIGAPASRTVNRLPQAKGIYDQRSKDLEVIQGLARAGSAMWKPHRIHHRFVCQDRRVAEQIQAYAAMRGYERSPISVGNENGRDFISFDLIKDTVPAISNITFETSAMADVALRFGATYEGWSCAVVN